MFQVYWAIGIFHWLVFWTGNSRLYLLMYTLQSSQKCPVHSTIHPMGAMSTRWKTVWSLTTLFAPCTLSHSCVLSYFSHVLLFVTPLTVASQTLLSMGSCRQEYWSGLPCPLPGYLPNPGIKPESSESPALQTDSLLLSHCWRPKIPSHATFNDNLSNVMLLYAIASQRRWYLCIQVCEYHNLRIPFWGSLLRPT